MQISPRDIENVVLRHPGVADVTAVGVADAVVNGNGQLAKAVVVLKPGYDDVTSNQLLAYANRKLHKLFYLKQDSSSNGEQR